MNAHRTMLAAAAALLAIVGSADAAKPRADLKVSASTAIPRQVAQGGQLSITFTVKNSGRAKAGKSTTELLLSTDAKRDRSDIRLASVQEKQLKPRKTAAHTVKATVAAATTPRRYTLLVCADAAAKVAESGEGNNCRAAAALEVTAKPGGPPQPPQPQPPSPPAPQPQPQQTLPTAVPTQTVTPTPSAPPAPTPSAPPALETTITESPGDVTDQQAARFAFTANRAGSTFECRLDDEPFAPCTSPKTYPDVLAGEHAFEVRARDPSGELDSTPARKAWRIEFEAPAPGPSDPPAAAPETKASTAPEGEMTLVGETTEFLYTGADPIQKQVQPGAIDGERAAVLRGRVTRRNGSAVEGVRVTVVDHPELGRTATRADGGFEIAVNGGGSLTLEFEREGYVPSQRQLEVPVQDFERVEEIVLVPYDDRVSGVDLADDELQVAQSAPVSDGDGTRRATLMLEPDTDATATLPNGQQVALGDRLNIRATEFTIGATGPAAMPGELPPTSAYTYAVEYSVDEASARQAVDVRFNKPIVTYVDNYLGFAAGTAVPMGYYDREKGQWIPAPDGVVIAILGEAGGRAQLDTDGDGAADGPTRLTALGIDTEELEKLADLHAPGKSLWRAAITHFTPWDYNWPYGLPEGAGGPDQPGPDDGDPDGDDPCSQGGSIILCEDQVLAEGVPIAGTPYTLAYQSDRVPGRRTGNSLEIPLTGSNPPSSLARVDLEIEVAGRTIRKSFARASNLAETFVFDGVDAYGRPVQGRQPVDVHIDYVYAAVYRTPGTFGSSFAAVGGQTIFANRTRQEISIRQSWSGTIGGLNAPPSALAGWSVDVHHTYDPIGRTLHFGDGTRRSADGQNFDVISTTRSGLAFPEGIAPAPDGSLLVADSSADVVRRIMPGGATTIVAGTGTPGFSGDGGAAAAAQLDHPSDVALAPDGAMLIADEGNNRIRRVAPDRTITTFAGTGEGDYAGDGGPATQARLDEPSDVAVDADGAVYVVDRANHAVRRIGTEGIIDTLAGNGSPGFGGDGGVATAARLRSPRDVAVRVDGSVFVADGGNHRVRRIGPDGTIETVAGNGSDAYTGDGGLATDAGLDTPSAVLPLRDGGILVADAGNAVLRKVASQGTIATVVGNGTAGFRGDDGPAGQARIDFPQAIALGADDAIYVADAGNDRVRALSPGLPGLQLGEFTIASNDGTELYVFDRGGRHLRTIDALTKADVLRFSYDSRGRLTGIEDGDGLDTTIQRDASGAPTAIVGPYGHVTSLQISAAGYVSRIANPAGERILLTYNAGGLLTELTDTRDGVHRFEYDSLGRLTRDVGADGSAQTLARNVAGGAVTVTHRSGEGRSTIYRVERSADGSVKRTVTDGAGRRTELVVAPDGVTTITRPGGTRVTQEIGPDPRFGMQAPVNQRTTITTPSGLRTTFEGARTAELLDPSDPLSLRTLVETSTVNGRTHTTRFDAAARRFTSSTPSGRTSTTDVDVHGRPTRAEVPGMATVLSTYDSRGRLTQTTQGTRTTSYSYDARGRVSAITDPLSRTTQFAYDLGDRIAAVQGPDGRQVAYGYDGAGNVLSVTPPGRSSHAFAYSSRDLLARYTPPQVGSSLAPTSYAADRDTLLTAVTRPGGGAITFAYDAGGRLERVTQPRGSADFGYADPSGNLTTATAPGGELVSYGYDGGLQNRSTASGTVAGEVTAAYDADLRLAAESVNGGLTAAYGYDQDGLLTGAAGMTIARGAEDGIVDSMTLGGTTTTLTVNAHGEPETVTTRQGSTPLYGETYGRDNLGRLTARTETRGAAGTSYVYTYDAADRLSQVTRDGALQATYSYDANGNRTQVQRAGELPTTAEYDAQDRLTRYGPNTYTYTDGGELRTKQSPAGTSTYDYDSLGALTRVALPDGAQVDYTIDAGGRRIAVRRNGVLQQGFLYGRALGPAAELNADGTVKSRFIYATRDNVPDIILRDGRTYRVITDVTGSPRAVVDTSNGSVAQEMDYDEFGRVTRDTNPGFQPFGFAGGLYDRHTGLVRFGLRDYDGETGRFTAPDPILFDGGQPNLYAYVGNDPVNYVDPTGEFITQAIGAATSVLTGWAISKLTGCDYSLTDALVDAGTGALGVGVFNKVRKLSRLSKLRNIAKNAGMTRQAAQRNLERYVGSHYARIDIKHVGNVFSPQGKLNPSGSWIPRARVRATAGTYVDPFTGAVGPLKSPVAHIPLEALPLAEAPAIGAAAGVAGGAARAGCDC